MTGSTKRVVVESAESVDESRVGRIADSSTNEREVNAEPTTARHRRLRARRIKVDDLALERLSAVGVHSSLGSFESRVDDLSLHGIRLIIERSDEPGLILAGDRLESLRLSAGEHVLYSGDALVRRVSETKDEWVLGVELGERAIDLDALYRIDRRTGVADKLRSAVAEHAAVSTEFKAWVADLVDFFEGTKRCLDKEEAALGQSDRWTRDQSLRDFVSEAAPIVNERLNRASIELSEFIEGLSDAERDVYRSFYRRHLCRYYHRAPLLSRAYHKPLGYAGDYEMMNMLYRDHGEGDTLFSKLVNVYACQEAAAQANINRIAYFNERLRTLIAANPGRRLRIASIGCGPAHEIRNLLEQHPDLGASIDIALVDQEEHAIQYCERTLAPLAAQTDARIHFIGESIRRLLTAKSLGAALGERDLIYSAGLFDYLSDRSFQALLRVLYGATAEGGHLYVGNVNLEKNTTKWSMEFASDWYLIHRRASQLLDLASELPHPSLVEVESEPLGVNLFLHVMR